MLKFSHSLRANAISPPSPNFDCTWSWRGGGGLTDHKAQLRQSKYYLMLIRINCQVTRGYRKQTQLALYAPSILYFSD